MEQLKKVISLNQAAKFSGYSQDYLGYLIRRGEIKATKVGKSWFTTEREIKNYLFKQKIRKSEFAFRDFFTISRAMKIIAISSLLFLSSFSVWFHMTNPKAQVGGEVRSMLNADAETIVEASSLAENLQNK
jgi:hypothetical protein